MAPIAPPHKPPRALIIAGIPPPIAMLWSKANRLPATTFPIQACIAAAIEPIGSKGLDVASIMRQEGTPAMGPATPKPTAPSSKGTRRGVATTPIAAAAAPMARAVKTRSR